MLHSIHLNENEVKGTETFNIYLEYLVLYNQVLVWYSSSLDASIGHSIELEQQIFKFTFSESLSETEGASTTTLPLNRAYLVYPYSAPVWS